MNLTEMDDGDAKRIVDFGAGVVFGLHGRSALRAAVRVDQRELVAPRTALGIAGGEAHAQLGRVRFQAQALLAFHRLADIDCVWRPPTKDA